MLFQQQAAVGIVDHGVGAAEVAGVEALDAAGMVQPHGQLAGRGLME